MLEKKDILIALIAHYTNGNKAQFAAKLGVTPQAISTWISRNTFDADRIFANCESISAEWLLTGSGSMLRTEYKAGRDNNVVNGENKGVAGNYGTINSGIDTMVSTPQGNYWDITVHNSGNNDKEKLFNDSMKDWRKMYLLKEKQLEQLKEELNRKLAEFTSDLKDKDAYTKKIIAEAYRRNEAKDLQIAKMLEQVSNLQLQIEKLTDHIIHITHSN